jgi:hypothetical protein
MNSLEQEVKNKAERVDALSRLADGASRAGQDVTNQAGAGGTPGAVEEPSLEGVTTEADAAPAEQRASWRGHFTDSWQTPATQKETAPEAAGTGEWADAPETRASWRGDFVDGWGDTWVNC